MAYKVTDKLGKFYTTSAPDSVSLPTFDSIIEAAEHAACQFAEGYEGTYSSGRARRYIVQVVAVVEKAAPPVKVTYYDKK